MWIRVFSILILSCFTVCSCKANFMQCGSFVLNLWNNVHRLNLNGELTGRVSLE